MITKTAITLRQLSNIAKGPVAKRTARNPSRRAKAQSNKYGPNLATDYADERVVALANGKLKAENVVTSTGTISRDQAKRLSDRRMTFFDKDDLNKIHFPDNYSADWVPRKLKIEGLHPKTKEIGKNILMAHELDEAKLLGKSRKMLRKGEDMSLPSGHVHPEVIMREHNILSTIDLPENEKAELIKYFRKFRAGKGVDADVFENQLKEFFGEYGNGIRLNRSARKHLSKKLLDGYQSVDNVHLRQFMKPMEDRQLGLRPSTPTPPKAPSIRKRLIDKIFKIKRRLDERARPRMPYGGPAPPPPPFLKPKN